MAFSDTVLPKVETLIETILDAGGVSSYSIDGTSLQGPDLKFLWDMRKDLVKEKEKGDKKSALLSASLRPFR